MLKIPFDKCGVKQMVGEEDGWIGHTLVVQHDDWLIFPGDLAFTVQCNHSDQVIIADISCKVPVQCYVHAFCS